MHGTTMKIIDYLTLDLELIPCEKLQTRFTIYIMGPTFILVTHFKPKINLVTFFNERGQISPLRFEGQFYPHVTKVVRMM
jgi:hypothetical protein